jgi:peptidoglycan/xylan/chitin deacetylase (PgdA/CDA1 family)
VGSRLVNLVSRLTLDSYDDGPSPYTPSLLNYMSAANLKSTFFVVGSRVISRPDMVQYEYLEGHQLAVHTWSHFPLTSAHIRRPKSWH